jgi:hypothetical protein
MASKIVQAPVDDCGGGGRAAGSSAGATAGGGVAALKALPRSPGKPDQCEFPGGLQCLEF